MVRLLVNLLVESLLQIQLSIGIVVCLEGILSPLWRPLIASIFFNGRFVGNLFPCSLVSTRVSLIAFSIFKLFLRFGD